MKAFKFFGTNETIQVGGMDTANSVVLDADTASTAFASNAVIEVVPTTTDVWIAIGTAPTATAGADGNCLCPFGSPTRPFGIDKGNKIIATGEVNIRRVD